jgi:glycosyltransferase involved in cell wall biosynthesis
VLDRADAVEVAMTPVPDVSVVVPARDAGAVIDEQLAMLAAQTYAQPFEVIVVDNESRDHTRARADAWRDRIDGLRVISAEEQRGAGYARNVGIRAARSDRVLLCDADDRVAPDWVAHLAAALERGDLVAGGVAAWRGTSVGPARGVGGAGFGFLPTLATCNAALHRRVWDALGGFDESLLTCEDIDFAWRAQLEGFTLVECPEAVVYHREPDTTVQTLRVWYGYGRDQPRLMARFGPCGLRADSPLRVVGKWGAVAVTSFRLVGPDGARRAWCREAARRTGRLVGSVRERSLYL